MAALFAVASAGPFLPLTAPLDGMLFDAGIWARWHLGGRQSLPFSSVAVVGLDWESLRDPELAPLPRALFSPVWAATTDALMAAGAKLVVFDMVFEYQGNTLLPNHDRPFLQALARHRGKVALARTGGTLPARPFLIAAGGGGSALGLSELIAEPDGVIRRVAASMPGSGGEAYPTLSGAALAALGQVLPAQPIRLLPHGPLEAELPRLSLIEVLRHSHSEEGRQALAQAIGGRVVFVGTVLPEEDRKVAPDRFLPSLDPASSRSGTVAGVSLHAAALASILEGRRLAEAPPWAVALLAGGVAALAAGAGVALSPVATLSAVGLGAAALLGAGWSAPPLGWYLPFGHALLWLGISLALGFGARYMAEIRRRTSLQRAFGHYLAPQVVAMLSKAEVEPELGGETREITCMFADLSGFTALSARLEPAALMTVTNRYLDLITQAVDASGGYVDKYIGDAVMAIWNAPVAYADHPVRAVLAAMEAAAAIRSECDAAAASGLPGFAVKIGLNTGSAVVGNLGARRRFNYSAVGEAVNLASRLEPVPALYRCSVVMGEATAGCLAGRVAVCELDLVKVKGKDTALRIFTPLPGHPLGHADFLAGWCEALNAYRAGRFVAAAAAWEALPPPADWPDSAFGPALVLAERCRRLALSPPVSWVGEWAVGKS
ncbi:putative Guanylate cyclase [Candidatus Terasakiella magnetica]|nr:putative Guanylate cyclase [Candidatus Terasakiella magnetica]